MLNQQKLQEQNQTRCADDIRGAAKKLFAARGFDSVSINDIALGANCSKSNIFHHFGSKQDLYFDVMREATQRSESRLRQIMGADKQARERLRHAVADHYRMIAEDPERARLMMREVMFSSPVRGRELAEKVFGEQFQTLTELMRTVNNDADGEPEFLAFMLIAANVMHFHCHNVLQHLPGAKFADDVDGYAQMVSNMLLQQLGDS